MYYLKLFANNGASNDLTFYIMCNHYCKEANVVGLGRNLLSIAPMKIEGHVNCTV